MAFWLNELTKSHNTDHLNYFGPKIGRKSAIFWCKMSDFLIWGNLTVQYPKPLGEQKKSN